MLEYPLNKFNETVRINLATYSSTYIDINKNKRAWDNIHWWGYRGEGQPIISAPGGFHAAHLHWRWGKNIQNESQFKSGIPLAGNQALTNNSDISLGGALVDPKIWIQTIKFSIVKNTSRFDINTENYTQLSKENFFTLFNTNNTPPPESVENGSDNILFYSIEAKREATIPERKQTIFLPRKYDNVKTKIIPAKSVKSAISGNYFIQGLFFGHEPEKDPFLRILTQLGSRTSEYNPSKSKIIKEKKWER